MDCADQEHEAIGHYRTVITYFFHEGTVYSDAVSTEAPPGVPKAVPMDELPVHW